MQDLLMRFTGVTSYAPAKQAEFPNRYATGLIPFNPSLMRSWLQYRMSS